MRLGVFIPCFRVAHSIHGVLSEISEATAARIDELVVVDNASDDKTVEIVEAFQQSSHPIAKKIKIIRNPTNLGHGGSQKVAFDYFCKNGFTHFLRLHGGGRTHSDVYIRNFLEILDKDPDMELIHANRFHPESETGHYSLARRLGNQFFNVLTRLLFLVPIKDAGSAEMFYKVTIIKQIPYHQLTNAPQFNPYLNILLYQLAKKVTDCNLLWKDAKSHINGVEYSIQLLKGLLRAACRKWFLGCKGVDMFGHPKINPPALTLPR